MADEHIANFREAALNVERQAGRVALRLNRDHPEVARAYREAFDSLAAISGGVNMAALIPNGSDPRKVARLLDEGDQRVKAAHAEFLSSATALVGSQLDSRDGDVEDGAAPDRACR